MQKTGLPDEELEAYAASKAAKVRIIKARIPINDNGITFLSPSQVRFEAAKANLGQVRSQLTLAQQLVLSLKNTVAKAKDDAEQSRKVAGDHETRHGVPHEQLEADAAAKQARLTVAMARHKMAEIKSVDFQRGTEFSRLKTMVELK